MYIINLTSVYKLTDEYNIQNAETRKRVLVETKTSVNSSSPSIEHARAIRSRDG